MKGEFFYSLAAGPDFRYLAVAKYSNIKAANTATPTPAVSGVCIAMLIPTNK
jgi:hypothetical protein